uniref:Uncharacterized protein n=1 Tax=Myripristis murdjan TaxID=586833 RepID=A0A667ZCB3_9TELE
MGIQGLISFIEANSQIYRDVQFRDSRLVVDGRNLTFYLSEQPVALSKRCMYGSPEGHSPRD